MPVSFVPSRGAMAAFVLASVLFGGSRATADVMLAFDKTTPVGGVTVQDDVGGTHSISGIPGPYYWHQTGSPADPRFSGTVVTFCVELDQHIHTGGTYTYQATPLASVVSPAEAALFGKLYADHYNTAWNNSGFAGSVQSIAFQLAVWELVYDGPSNLDLGTGHFQYPGANLSNTSTAAGLAQSWLGGLGSVSSTAFTTTFPGQGLFWLGNQGSQDQIALVPDPSTAPVPVPAPATLPIWVLGAIGCMTGWAAIRHRVSTANAHA